MKLEIKYSKIYEILKNENILVESKQTVANNINYISYDSRDIKENTLFFCKGKNYKEEYLKVAIEKGSVVYISETKYDIDNCSYFIVNNIRRAMASIALEFYNHSFNKLETIGITGTKGKTTVSYFLRNILNEYTKSKTAIISTVETYTGKREEESHLTTPEPLDLQKFFYETVESKIKYLTMEVTSQAYKMDRVYGTHFKNGMFLNIAEDHISDAEHPNFEDYLNCKLQLFKNSDRLVINADTDYFKVVMDAAKDKEVILYGTNNKADYYYTNIKKEIVGFSFDVKNDKTNYLNNFKISIEGRFNIENALAAITMAKVLNVDDESIKKGLIITQVQGRMNVFENNGITVIVDYAHNELSFTKLYESIKLDYPGRKVISVGGGPGGKAYARRKSFGIIVGNNSDYIYLTAEDPQFEEIKDIAKDIASYIAKTPYEIVVDRTEAIEKAFKNAKQGDIIVLLAKGEEDYQKVRGTFIPYESDLKIAKRLLKI
ncbi:MAG: UDP-N-acetylmuramoyl-L-alanyl-D-glutamate--2,6-diaminopimelate ligase [Clostridia bacterium]